MFSFAVTILNFMKLIFTFALIIATSALGAQTLCPGGGLDFSSSVTFQPSWISGCTTGTSCNGATNFDNRTSCEPTAAIDPCAPVPTGVPISDCGSDLWYDFIALDTAVYISVIKNVSFMASIQAFSTSTGICSNLTQIGIAHSVNPSGPVGLNLGGLTIGQKYYFRVFGVAKPASQRTGLFCFCGSTGFTASTLPIDLVYFEASNITESAIELKWGIKNEQNFSHFEIERRLDSDLEANFKMLRIVYTNFGSDYQYTDLFENLPQGVDYRLKLVDLNGEVSYSEIATFIPSLSKSFKVLKLTQSQININSTKDLKLTLFSVDGRLLESLDIKKGTNAIEISLNKGIYFAMSNNKFIEKLILE